MPDKLTDLSGIGDKTAEKLKSDGIETPEELGDAYRANSRRVTTKGKRVQSAAREALFETQDSFVDPASGVEIDDSNRTAFEKLATKRVSEFESVSVDGANSKVFPDDEVRKFVEPVRQGRFKTDIGGDDNLLAFAADTAQNLGADELSAGELQDLNRAGETAQEELTLRKKGSVGTTKAVGTTTTGDFYRAQAVHQDRSPKARRVDKRREAEQTTDFNEWAVDPSRHDFPGVDTPSDAGEFFPEERTSRNSAGFGSSTLTNTDRRKAKRAFETLGELNDEQERRLFGDTYDADSPI
jgi:hypothetical protein